MSTLVLLSVDLRCPASDVNCKLLGVWHNNALAYFCWYRHICRQLFLICSHFVYRGDYGLEHYTEVKTVSIGCSLISFTFNLPVTWVSIRDHACLDYIKRKGFQYPYEHAIKVEMYEFCILFNNVSTCILSLKTSLILAQVMVKIPQKNS